MENIYKEIIKNRIIKLISINNLNAEQLAYRSGLAKSTLSEIIHGKKTPKIYTILRLCAGLGITIKEFFDFEEINNLMDEL